MTARKERVLVLGAAAVQVPIIETAARLGFETVVASSPGAYPGFRVADRFYEIDIRDREAILAMARREGICGILTDQTDVAVPTVAYVAERLGLPGINLDCALKFTDKHRMRLSAEELGVPVPRFLEISNERDAAVAADRLTPPLIVKPVDSQGSRGVSRIDDPADLWSRVQAAARYSSAGRVIAEEFFEGVEVVVQGFASDFEFVNLAVGDRQYFDIPEVFIPKATIFPSMLPESLMDKVLSANARLVRGFGPRFGITHSEFLVNPATDEIRLVETAIRGGGVFISSDLVPIASGIDIGRLLVEHATGRLDRMAIDLKTAKKRAAGYFCFYLPAGRICRVEGVETVKSLPGVQRAVLDNIRIGSVAPPLTDKTARLGPIIIAGDDRAMCDATFQKVKETLRIEVLTDSGLDVIRW